MSKCGVRSSQASLPARCSDSAKSIFSTLSAFALQRLALVERFDNVKIELVECYLLRQKLSARCRHRQFRFCVTDADADGSCPKRESSCECGARPQTFYSLFIACFSLLLPTYTYFRKWGQQTHYIEFSHFADPANFHFIYLLTFSRLLSDGFF